MDGHFLLDEKELQGLGERNCFKFRNMFMFWVWQKDFLASRGGNALVLVS